MHSCAAAGDFYGVLFVGLLVPRQEDLAEAPEAQLRRLVDFDVLETNNLLVLLVLFTTELLGDHRLDRCG